MTDTTKPTPIAIVGMGCRFAGARDLHEYWEMTREGRHGFSEPPRDRWDHEAFYNANPRIKDRNYAPVGGFMDDIRSFPSVALSIPPRRVEVMDPQQRLALEISHQAIADAGLTPSEMPKRTGVFMGVSTTEWRTLMSSRVLAQMMVHGDLGVTPEDGAAVAAAVSKVVPARPFSAPGYLANMSAAIVAQQFGYTGPAYTTDAACASALVAAHDAVKALRDGTIEAAVVGGSYVTVTPEQYVGFTAVGAMSRNGACLPFDEKADGFVQGEGCGVVVMKRLDDAIRDGDRIYSVINGVGINNDGGGDGPMAPIKEGQAEVISLAWDESGVDMGLAGYVEAHGTGTSVGDKAEFEGLQETIGRHTKAAAIGSSKANVGHTMAAAGIAGLIRTSLAIYHRAIPPMAGFETPKPEVPVDDSNFFIPKQAVPWEARDRVAGISSFGFGGTNVHMVVSSADPVDDDLTEAPGPQAELVLLSAADPAALRETARRTAAAIAEDPDITVAGVARAWAKRLRQPARAGIVASTREELIERLGSVADGSFAEGAVYGEAHKDPKVAFMYPGQGAQRLGMIAGIRDRFDLVQDVLDEMDGALDGTTECPVTHLLYPEKRAEEIDDDAAFAQLTATENCQPALFTVGIALTRLLEQVGVKPTVVTGHSVGEFTAAAAAGVLSAEEGARWTAHRGQGMNAMTGDPGGMVAVVAEPALVEPLLVEGSVIANYNHPKQTVVSGTSEAIQAVAERAEAEGFKAVVLRVSHGFHSPIFEQLDLSDTIDAIPMSDPQVPVASGIIDHPYRDAAEAREVFHKHATSPVVFTRAIEQCVEAGANIFLQVASGGPLLSFARGTLTERPLGILPLASKDDNDGGFSLLMALAELWIRGVDVDVTPITAPASVASVPPVVLGRSEHWIIRKKSMTLKVEGAAAAATPETETAPKDVEVKAPKSGDVEGAVLAAVARASAYPLDALRPAMRLIEDLGFDSMMVADLAEEMIKTVPGVTGLPQELFLQRPTIQDLIDFVNDGGADAAGADDDDAPLKQYVPVWVRSGDLVAGADRVKGTKVALHGQAGGAAYVDAVGAALEHAGALVGDFDAAHTDTLIWILGDQAPTVGAVLAGEAATPDYAGELIAHLDLLAKAEREANVVVLRVGDNAWGEALSGVARAVNREWPDRMVKAVLATPTADLGAITVAELNAEDLSADVRYDDGARELRGHRLIAEAATPWAPSAGQTVLVTGGSRGIGWMITERLLSSEAHVVIVDLADPSDELAKTVADNPRLGYAQANILDTEQLRTALAAATDGFPMIHAVVHSAGLLADGPLGAVDPGRGALARKVKIEGLINVARAAGTSLELVYGIASWAGRFGNRHQAHYAAANAMLSGLAEAGAGQLRIVTSEFGPWTSSEMAASIPQPVQAAMRAEGVDFVGDEAGLNAIFDDLGAVGGPVVRGRRVPGVLRRAERAETFSAQTHPFLLDHAIEGHPVVPFAMAVNMMAEVAALQTPFAIQDVTLFSGLVVDQPTTLKSVVDGARVEVHTDVLAYKAKAGRLDTTPEAPDAREGDAPALGLDVFYAEHTFHGPLLRAIEEVQVVGSDYVRGVVRTGTPSNWIPETTRTRWAVDPLVLDGVMQLAGYVAHQSFGRAGTPVGMGRYAQLRPMPAGTVMGEVFLGELDGDRVAMTLVVRDMDRQLIATVDDVVVQLREIPAQADAEASDASPTEGAWEGFTVKEEWVNPAAWEGYQDIKLRQQMAVAIGLSDPYFDVHEGTARNTTVVEGRELIHYSGYNYLGLSGDERVRQAVKDTIDRYGTSVSASRVAGGERPYHHELEMMLAKAQDVEDAVVMPAGHATNVTTIGHLFGTKDLILHDELIHDSCLQGTKLSGAARRGFRHEDFEHLEAQLKELRPHYEKVLILIEGVYSMDGDVASLPEFIRLKKKYGCMLMVDEAHSFGTIGATGYGVREYYDIPGSDVDIWMGTMSKSLASMGGWIAGSKELIEYLRYTTPGFVFAAGLAPALGAAALKSIQLWSTTDKWRVEKLQANCKFFYNALIERGMNTGPAKGESPVIPVVTGDSMQALHLSDRLLKEGINSKPIIFPAVADDEARLRFFVNSTHTEEQLLHTAERVAAVLGEIRKEMGAM